MKIENCTGCSACYNICNKDAIKMRKNKQGFAYPIIDKKKCVNCSLCYNICPVINNSVKGASLKEVYALKNKNIDIRIKSSSGGFFDSIAKNIINKNGYVFGAVFDKTFKVIHAYSNNLKDLDRFKGSKYTQSDVMKTFNAVKNYLLEGYNVLYTGTPCQIDGLSSFLGGININNLITCDNVCHGVVSPKLFNSYLKMLEKENNSVVKSFSFRYKDRQRTQNIFAEFKNGKQYIGYGKEDCFYKIFFKNIGYRASCYNCRYANTNRVADITVGDYWGIEDSIKDFDDGKGISLVLINTDKGRRIFSEVINDFEFKKSNLIDCMQPNLKESTPEGYRNHEFWEVYLEKGFESALEKVVKESSYEKDR